MEYYLKEGNSYNVNDYANISFYNYPINAFLESGRENPISGVCVTRMHRVPFAYMAPHCDCSVRTRSSNSTSGSTLGVQ